MAMSRRTRWWLLGGAAALVVAVAAVTAPLFLPEKAQRVSEAAPEGGTVVKEGSFRGLTGHRVSGTVQIVEVDGAYVLRFEDYRQTQGPDVFVYLTPSPTPDSYDEIQAGLKVLLDGGADGGESTKEGSFNQRLPAGFDPAAFEGVGIWCDRFRTEFGYATLT